MNDFPNPGRRRGAGISVTGVGTVSVEPDIASLSVSIRWQDQTLAGARSTVSAKSVAARDHLLAAGVQPADLQTTQLTVHTIRHHPDRPGAGRAPFIEFQVSTTLNAVFRGDLAQAQAAVDGLFDVVGEGLELHGLGFDCDDRSAAAAAARHLAFEDARIKAAQLAELAGIELGPVRSIREGDPGRIPGPPIPHGRAMAMAEMAPIPVEGGSLRETAVLHIRWAVGADEA